MKKAAKLSIMVEAQFTVTQLVEVSAEELADLIACRITVEELSKLNETKLVEECATTSHVSYDWDEV